MCCLLRPHNIDELPTAPSQYTVADYYSARVLETNIRGFLVRTKLRPLIKETPSQESLEEADKAEGAEAEGAEQTVAEAEADAKAEASHQ